MQVLVPISQKNEHWIVAKICLKEMKIVMYDSLSQSEDSRKYRFEFMKPFASLLPTILRRSEYYNHISTPAPPYKEWELESLDPAKVNIPQQLDRYCNF